MSTHELVTAYQAAVKEAERMDALLSMNKVKSTGDWWLLYNARERRDELAALLEGQDA